MEGETPQPQLFLPATTNKQMVFCFWLPCHEEANSHFAINVWKRALGTTLLANRHPKMAHSFHLLKIPIHLKNENLNILHILCLCAAFFLVDAYFVFFFCVVVFCIKENCRIKPATFVPEIPAANNKKI